MTSIRATTSLAGPHDQPSRIVTYHRAKSYVIVSNASGGIMKAKWTSDDVPGQRGRLAVVTGANTGLGFETARVLAARGASVVLAVRDIEKGKRAAAAIAGTAPGADVMVQPLDLASLDSIRAAAGELRAKHPRIDLLINNAGVMFTPKQTTRDGFELQLEPVTGGLLGREHHPGVVDQQVDPRVLGPQLACGGADGIQRGQVEGLDHDVRAGGGAGDAGGGALALLGVPHCQHHRRAARGEDPGGLEPEAGIRAGDHG